MTAAASDNHGKDGKKDDHPKTEEKKNVVLETMKKNSTFFGVIILIIFVVIYAATMSLTTMDGSTTTVTSTGPSPEAEKQIAILQKQIADLSKGPPKVKKASGDDLGDGKTVDSPQKPQSARERLEGMTAEERAQLDNLLGKRAEGMLGEEDKTSSHQGHLGVRNEHQAVPVGCTERQVVDKETGYTHVRVTCPPKRNI
jgi:hypothetical protein